MAHFPAPLTNVSWICSPSQGSTCAPNARNGDINGTGDIDALIRLDAGVSVSYNITATIAGNAQNGAAIGATATITAPVGINDSNAGNNRASDVHTVVFTQCAPRPSVTHRVDAAGAGRVQATLEAIRNSDQVSNALQSVRLGNAPERHRGRAGSAGRPDRTDWAGQWCRGDAEHANHEPSAFRSAGRRPGLCAHRADDGHRCVRGLADVRRRRDWRAVTGA